MSELQDKLTTSIYTRNAVNNTLVSSYGIVSKINEKENVCRITYQNSAGKAETLEDVEVKITKRNDNWFPKVGELVETQSVNGGKPIIIGSLIRDYIQDVRENREYKKDILPDNKGTVRGKIT